MRTITANIIGPAIPHTERILRGFMVGLCIGMIFKRHAEELLQQQSIKPTAIDKDGKNARAVSLNQEVADNFQETPYILSV